MMKKERKPGSSSNDQVSLSYDMMMDGDDVIMFDADDDESDGRSHHVETTDLKQTLTRQKTDVHFTLPSEKAAEDDDEEAYVNVRLSKKRAEMALAAYLIPENHAGATGRSKRPPSPPPPPPDHCQCSSSSSSSPCPSQQLQQQQQQHYHYYSNQYHHHHHHYHQPYFHGGTTIIYNNRYHHPLTLYSGIDISHHDPSFAISSQEKTDTSIIELEHSHPPSTTSTPIPTTPANKKRARPATNEEEEKDQKCYHNDHPTLKKQKRRNKK